MAGSGNTSRRRLLVGIAVAVAVLVVAAGVVLLKDRREPKDDRTTLELSDEWRSVPGVRDVVAIERSRRIPGEDFGEADRWEHAVEVEVTLEDDLTMAEAAGAGKVVDVLAPEIARLAPEAGERTSALFTTDSVDIRASGSGLGTAEAVGDGLGDAVALRDAGASEVTLPLSSPPVGISDQAHARAPEGRLIAVITAARDQERPVDVKAGDAWYRTHGIPDPAAARLTLDVSQRPQVTSAQLASDSPLVVLVDAAEGDDAIEEVRQWVAAYDRYPGGEAQPLEFTVEGTRGGEVAGWVGGKMPPRTTMPPFGDARPWPDDPAALPCGPRFLEVTFGSQDAALGSRQASLHAVNLGDRPCVVEAVPTVEFLDAEGVPQADVTVDPYQPSMVPERLVVPVGESVTALIDWRAMSTADDPGVTTDLRVIAVPGAEPVTIPVGGPSQPTDLDVLDGAEVRISPWAQSAVR
ncbi:hypothetical protein J2S40_004299 [Nocardioides luteus]|uniref:DUF4232 domain-containing protein n=1 Tax=Nocardioides luteus TaxID=1844 RepID=A0ABQ5SRA1_9ACTN|nr:DUF4232 domain-containing protein [Nocardioides luteus]MDR7313241.1 hypothetical protein [Nocardioides luteus]GGR43078.1 hypothetical protein GCM10010197_05560 [Nocardioides luteus]GLJ66306.1 hypothetical protein GCM10017579_03420 [Nocardioides luteus]